METKTYLWQAELSTKNFDFYAYGTTKTEAKQALKATFERHILERGGWYQWKEIKDDVFYSVIKAGKGYVR